DALGAKLVEQARFPLTFISGYSVAATQLGLPDFGYLTQTEMVAVAKRVCGSVKIPVIIDADTGYGNALNVIRTVNELIDAGAAPSRFPPPLGADMLEGGVTPLLTRDELEQIGFQLVVCPLTALYASAKAMQDMFGLIKSAGTTRAALDRLIPFQQFHGIIDL